MANKGKPLRIESVKRSKAVKAQIQRKQPVKGKGPAKN